MKKVSLIFLFTMAVAGIANAQATRTWVSGVGDDVNPCSRTAPCKTFAGAISKTAAGGIINCLDPGGFGAVTITKALTIDCTGTLGSALSSGVQGIIVNAPTNASVVLRNLDINGAGVTLGTNGINVIQAGSVTVFNCHIANYSNTGIETTNTSNAISLMIHDSQILNVGSIAVLVNSTATGTTKLTVSGSYISNSGNGIDLASPNSSAQVTDSIITKNTGVGFQIENTLTSGMLESSTFSFNGTGVSSGISGQTPTTRLSRCNVFNNATGVGGTGTTACFSNNVIAGNTGGNACTTPNQAQQ